MPTTDSQSLSTSESTPVASPDYGNAPSTGEAPECDGLTGREWELCTGNCPPERPCPPKLVAQFRRYLRHMKFRTHQVLPRFPLTDSTGGGGVARRERHRENSPSLPASPTTPGRTRLRTLDCVSLGEPTGEVVDCSLK